MSQGRTVLVLFLALIPASARADDDEPAKSAPVETAPRSQLDILIDKSRVDLKEHRLEVKMNHVASKVTIKVYDDTGAVLADQEQDFSGRAPGTTLVVAWAPSSDAPVGKIEVFAYDKDGFYKGVAIVPWSVSVPHEEVNFRRDSADIDDSEKPKLEASFVKVTEAVASHKDLGKITLFIAGHTDTVGTAAYNAQLSRARAQSIASWFRRRGLKIGIAFEGFGESALLVKTPDDTDEPKNRRVDYILAIDEPVMKTSGLKPAWKRIN
jgi:outer membrane protein OmpA-like peptidoglycan-associated protein